MKAFRLFCVVIVLSLALFTVTPAQAIAPVTWEGDFSGTGEFNCGSFSITEEWTSHAEIKEFYDSDGNWVLLVGLITAQEHLFANGKDAYGQAKIVKHWRPDYWSDRGLGYHIVVPGAGTIFIDAGLVYATEYYGTLTLHGNHQLYDGDLAKLCAYFQ